MSGDFAGRVALVTGASRGIGRAIATALAARGADVIVNYRSNDAEARAACDAILKAGGKAEPWKADVADRAAAPRMVDAIAEKRGRLDILVNNAGTLQDGPLMLMSDAQWDSVVRPALDGAFLCSRAAVRPMIGQHAGSILNVASISARLGVPGQANYAAAKAGLLGFTRSLASEVAPFGIRVNAVAPGLIETDMAGQIPAATRARIVKSIPMRRPGTVDEVASAALFLLSDAASYITGECLDVDGGM